MLKKTSIFLFSFIKLLLVSAYSIGVNYGSVTDEPMVDGYEEAETAEELWACESV